MNRTAMRTALALLLAVACAWGLLEVHSSTDTWIGLASGRAIFTAGHVPLTDGFSYTAAGRPWLNQNWLTHAVQYWLYSHAAPDAVVWFNWLLALVLFAASGWVAWRRSGSGGAGLLAAAVTAFGCRDFLTPRPATAGLCSFALAWAILAVPVGTLARVVALTAVLLVWGQAHGSFPLGYLLVALFTGDRLIAARRDAGSGGRPWLEPFAAVVALALTVALSPYHLDHFKGLAPLGGSSFLSTVAEWTSPLVPGGFPPTRRFWAFVAAGFLVVAASLLRPVGAKKGAGPPVSPFDCAVTLVAFVLALRARRFVPLVFIVTPSFLAMLAVPRLREWGATVRDRLRVGVSIAAAAFALGLAMLTVREAASDRVQKPGGEPPRNLLEWVTAYDQSPVSTIDYLARNDLGGNLFLEWTQAGPVLLNAPRTKVYIDGRAQQLFDELTYANYGALMLVSTVNGVAAGRVLDGLNTDGSPASGVRADAILLRDLAVTKPFWRWVDRSGAWVPVLLTPDAVLYGRGNGAWLQSIRRRIDAGTEWRPDIPSATAARGNLFITTTPPDTISALRCYLEGVYVDPTIGVYVYPAIDGLLRGLGRPAEADSFLAAESARIAAIEPPIEAGKREKLDHLLQQLRSGR